MTEPQKPVWRERMDAEPDALALAFTAGRDVAGRPAADLALAPYDVWTNRAHVAMLADCGILEEDEARRIGAALETLESHVESGRFALDPALEDIHINIEQFVAREAGEAAAGKMHTARSRNDQALTDMRLLMRDAIGEFARNAIRLAEALIERARADAELPLPGYSHTQPGMVSSLGHWWAAHAQALERDVGAFRALEPLADASPLGAAAGFGSTWPIDRERAAKYLGFESVQANSLDCVASRGELEERFAAAAASLMNHISGLAEDLIFLSSPPRRFIILSDAYATGSSIMPQKRNPDFCEVARARAAVAHGHLQALLGIRRGALTGYNRDSQWTKYAALDLIEETRDAALVFAGAVAAIRTCPEAMEAACREDFLNAVEVADYLAQTAGIPFRQAHALVAAACRRAAGTGHLSVEDVNQAAREAGLAIELDSAAWADVSEPSRILRRRQSLGAPNPALALEELKPLNERLEQEMRRLADRAARLEAARKAAAERLR